MLPHTYATQEQKDMMDLDDDDLYPSPNTRRTMLKRRTSHLIPLELYPPKPRST